MLVHSASLVPFDIIERFENLKIFDAFFPLRSTIFVCKPWYQIDTSLLYHIGFVTSYVLTGTALQSRSGEKSSIGASNSKAIFYSVFV